METEPKKSNSVNRSITIIITFTDVIQENDIQLKPFVKYLEELILDKKLMLTQIKSETAKDALKIIYDKILHDLVDSGKVQKLKEILNLLQENSSSRKEIDLVFNGYKENASFLISACRKDNFYLVKAIVDR